MTFTENWPDVSFLYYFFSTLAQTFAALVALLLAAGQSRITWPDNAITRLKFNAIKAMNVAEEYEEIYREWKSATQVVLESRSHPNSDAKQFAAELGHYIFQMQRTRSNLRYLFNAGLIMVATGLIGLALTPKLFERGATAVYLTVGLTCAAALLVLILTTKFVYSAFYVGLKNDI